LAAGTAPHAPKQSLGAGYRNGEKYPEADDMASAFRAAANLAITFCCTEPRTRHRENPVPVTDSASMRRKRYAVLHRPTPERVSGFSDGVLWFNFAHLFSMSLLPLSTAWMANSELAPQPVAFLCSGFLPRERHLHMLDLGAH
jgi:hypothetical protein